MLKKHIIFQILYTIVGPLCPASLKCLVFYKVPPSDKHSLLWLATHTHTHTDLDNSTVTLSLSLSVAHTHTRKTPHLNGQ